MADIELVIKIDDETYKQAINRTEFDTLSLGIKLIEAVQNGTPLTPEVLADMLMEERIRGEMDSDTTFEKDIIPDVKGRLTVSIRDHRPCYCGAGLREVWRESRVK